MSTQVLSVDDSIEILTIKAQNNKVEIQSTEYVEDEFSLIDDKMAAALGVREGTMKLKLAGRFNDLLNFLGDLRVARDVYLDIVKFNIHKMAGSEENCEIFLDLKIFLST